MPQEPQHNWTRKGINTCSDTPRVISLTGTSLSLHRRDVAMITTRVRIVDDDSSSNVLKASGDGKLRAQLGRDIELERDIVHLLVKRRA